MKYKGKLNIATEMCCGSWLQFHDDRGLYGDDNQFWSWKWTLNFNKRSKVDSVKIYDKDENIVYSGSFTFDKIDFKTDIACPKEITIENAYKYFGERYNCEIETDELVDALKDDKDTED